MFIDLPNITESLSGRNKTSETQIYIGFLLLLLFLLVVQSLSRVLLRDPMDCNMPRFPVLHYFPEFAQIHIC